MIQIGNYVADITITLQDGEVTKLLGIDDDRLNEAYDAVDWDGIEDALGDLARTLVAAQATAVREAIGAPKAGDGGGEYVPKRSVSEVWCRFSTVPKVADGRAWYPPLDIDDIRPALDRIPIESLPEWGEDWNLTRYGGGDGIVSACEGAGLIDEREWQRVEFDGIDEYAYEDYYDWRLLKEGLPSIER